VECSRRRRRRKDGDKENGVYVYSSVIALDQVTSMSSIENEHNFEIDKLET
jgi:hypothetical protein